jgi:KaiC/GvpD/RAD55 family RecA-like ATPase
MNNKCCTEKYVKFGIDGVDDLFRPIEKEKECGIPRGSSVILSGDMGTGKTTFLMQFLKHGIEEGEKGVFVSLEESPYNLLRDYCHWRFNGATLIDILKNGTLTIIDGTSLIEPVPLSKQIEKVIGQYYPQHKENAQKIPKKILRPWEENMELDFGKIVYITDKDYSNIPNVIRKALRKLVNIFGEPEEKKIDKKNFRVCLDSLTSLLCHRIGKESENTSFVAEKIRETIVKLRAILEVSNATTLFSAEAIPAENTETGFTTAWRNIENFVARGAIQLGYHEYGKGDLVRYLRILKMRGVGHSTAKYAFEITNKEIEWIGELI